MILSAFTGTFSCRNVYLFRYLLFAVIYIRADCFADIRPLHCVASTLPLLHLDSHSIAANIAISSFDGRVLIDFAFHGPRALPRSLYLALRTSQSAVRLYLSSARFPHAQYVLRFPAADPRTTSRSRCTHARARFFYPLFARIVLFSVHA